MTDPLVGSEARRQEPQLTRYTIEGHGQTAFKLIEDPQGAWMQSAEVLKQHEALQAALDQARQDLQQSEKSAHKWMIDFGLKCKSLAAAEARASTAEQEHDFAKRELEGEVLSHHRTESELRARILAADSRAFELAAQVSFVCGTDTEDTMRAARAVLVKRAEKAEATLAACAALPRYKVSEIDDMLLPNPVPDGDWVQWSALLALLEGKNEK